MVTKQKKKQAVINLRELVPRNMTEEFKDIVDNRVDKLVMRGGRSSAKSQVVSEGIVAGVMKHRQSACCVIKYSNKIHERLVNTFIETLRFYGEDVEQKFKLRKSPYELVLLDENGRETDISIMFCAPENDPQKLKSFKPRSGSFKYVWFEEATDFTEKEISSLEETLIRGTGDHLSILTYNPPEQTSNWVNVKYNAPIGKVLGHTEDSYIEECIFEINGVEHTSIQKIHHSTYLSLLEDNKAHFCGKNFLFLAEQCRLGNNRYYRWAYLGEVIGTDANVFANVVDWKFNPEQVSTFKSINRGLDMSNGGSDPFGYTATHLDKANNILYITDEIYENGSIANLSVHIKQKNPHNFPIKTDGAVPAFTTQLKEKGVNCSTAKKGADSVRAGILWLQSLNGICIDKLRCPNAFREFTNLEYKVDKKTGKILTDIEDKNNHLVDSVRYGNSELILHD